MYTLLWIIAVICVVAGIYRLASYRDLPGGLALILIGLLIGPGGVSLFNL